MPKRPLWKSEVRARERLLGLRLAMKARKEWKKSPSPPICRASCLICGDGYENSISNLKQGISNRSVEEISSAFTAFGKALLVPYKEVAAWDFSAEPLPLCPSCQPSLFRIAQLTEALERIQLEIQQKADLVKEKIVESQNKKHGESNSDQVQHHDLVQEDERVTRFRRFAIGGGNSSGQICVKCERTDTPGYELMFESSLVEGTESVRIEDAFGGNDEFSPAEGNSYGSESSNESTDEAELDDEGRLRKKRARLLLHRFKSSQSSNRARASSLAKSDDLTVRVLPRRKASLAFLKRNKSKRADSDSDNSSCSDKRKRARDSKSKEKIRISEPVDDKDPGFEEPELNYVVDAKGRRRRVRRVLETDPIQFKEVNGQPVYREILILKEAVGRYFNYTCTNCSMMFRRSRAIARHIDNYFIEKVAKPYEKRDGKLFYKDVEVTELEQNSGFACTLCAYQVKAKHGIFMHIDRSHLGEFPFICEFCSKGFMKRRNIREHIQFVHEGQRTECDICGKPLKGEEMVKRHKWSHMNQEDIEAAVKAGAKRPLKHTYDSQRYKHLAGKFDCPHCDRSYKTNYILKDHIQVIHFGKKISCTRPGCDAEFTKRAELNLHYQDFHQEIRRDYGCLLCNKRYPSQSQLKYHCQGVHNIGEKDFRCEVCSLQFARKCLLNNHMKTHSDVREYQCDLCDKAYKSAHNLKTHWDRHQGM